MQQDNSLQYYMVVDEKSTGPFNLDEVILHPQLTPETLVWKPGLDNWVAAKTLPELDIAFRNPSQPNYQTPPEFTRPHYQERPHYQHPYEQRPHYPRNNYQPGIRTNWLPWAIVATVVGFFASCIGAIFGIIGIVQANKANNLYAQGYDREADAANSNARVMTIIGLIFAGIGIVVAFWFGNILSGLSNLSYM